MDSTLETARPAIKQPPAQRANALIGAALQIKPRGRVLMFVRMVWLTVIAFTLIVGALTIPARWSHLLIIGAENSIALQQLGLPQNFIAYYVGALDTMSFVVYTFVGVLIFLRKSQEWIGLFSSLALITAVVAIIRPADSLLFVDAPLRVPILIVFAIGIASIVTFIYIFPDGHFAPRWTRWLTFGLILFTLYSVFSRSFTQPMEWPPAPISPLILLGVFFGAVMQVYRYRRISDPLQKQQTKWVVYGLSIAAFGLLSYVGLVPLALPRVLLPGMTRVLYILIGIPLFHVALWMFPLSLALSILKYRLWEIDLIMSRTLVYVLLTGILAGLFAALEKIMQDLFIAVTGQTSDFATVISTLIVVAAFTPLKELLHTLVEKTFKDAGDPTVKLKAFGERVQARVSPIHPAQIARRLLTEAAAAYGAKGGAAYITQEGKEKLIQTIGEWDGVAAMCVDIQNGVRGVRFGMIALDDRKNGAVYTEHDRKAMDELAERIARALEEDQAAAAPL